MGSTFGDIRYAFRGLSRMPGFAAVAIATFALGIGATTAIFSAVYAVVLQPFPFRAPDRVIAIGEKFRGEGLSAVSPGNFEDWRRRATFYTEIAARAFVSVNVAGGETPERLVGNRVTWSYFRVFDMSAALGRTFTADEDQPGGDSVVVLSDRLWRRLFASDRSVVGRSIQLDGRPHTIIGVMPRAFDGMTGGAEEFWIPAAFTAAQLANHDGHAMTVFARLIDGRSIEQAAAELQTIFNTLKAQNSDNQIRQGIVSPFAAQVIGDSRQRLLVLFGAVGLVMLISCGNVAHLLLARGRLRTHEIALRASLGASQRRIVRQLLTESLVLAVIGGVVGVGVAYVAVPALLAIAPEGVPRLDQTTISPPVLLFALAATIVSAIATGTLPALRGARLDLKSQLSEGGRGVARGRDALRSVLVAAEVALAIVLLTGAGLLVRSAIFLQSTDGGFDGRGVLTARVSLPTSGYEEPVRIEQTFADLVDALQRNGNVAAAAIGSSVPMTPGGTNNGLVPEGKTFDPNDFVLGRLGIVSERYFEAFRIPLRAGRAFTDRDRRETERVMILSETAARQLFPGQNAIGKRVACCEPAPDGSPAYKIVVGIVGDVRTDGPQQQARADFYLPVRQAPPAAWTWLQRTMSVVVQSTSDDSASLTATLRTAVRNIDPSIPVHDIATMRQRLQSTLAQDRFNTVLMLLLGVIGLSLSAIGIYGVIACFVAQRRHEVAIRMALGARASQVMLMVLGQGMRPVWAGVVIGVVSAVFAARMLADNVYGVTTRDPLTFVVVVLVLVTAAVVANLIPARTAARMNPARLLVN